MADYAHPSARPARGGVASRPRSEPAARSAADASNPSTSPSSGPDAGSFSVDHYPLPWSLHPERAEDPATSTPPISGATGPQATRHPAHPRPAIRGVVIAAADIHPEIHLEGCGCQSTSAIRSHDPPRTAQRGGIRPPTIGILKVGGSAGGAAGPPDRRQSAQPTVWAGRPAALGPPSAGRPSSGDDCG